MSDREYGCASCAHLIYNPFEYYGGLTGYSPESWGCAKKREFYYSELDKRELVEMLRIAETCPFFEPDNGP